jgi:hypothetical protein
LGKEGNEIAQREGTCAWRLRVDNRLLDVRRLEPDQEVEILERGIVEITRPVVRERNPALRRDLDRFGQRRRVLERERPIRADRHGKPERESLDERLGQRATKAIARADERNRERFHARPL